MYEQDIQLARLLVEKLTMMQQRAEKVRGDLEGAQGELERLNDIRQEREAYLEVLSRAAKLLDRADLQVDSPESREAEENVRRLQQQLSEVEAEAAEFNVIISELRDRAPQLLAAVESELGVGAAAEEDAAAEGAGEIAEDGADEAASEDSEAARSAESSESSEAAEAVEARAADVSADESEEPSSEEALSEDGEEATEPSVPSIGEDGEPARYSVEFGSAEEAAAALQGSAEAVEVASAELQAEEVTVGTLTATATQSQNGNHAAEEEKTEEVTAAPALDRKQVLQRFNLRNIRAKEAFTYGRNAIYVLDTPSIISRIPNYDISVRRVPAPVIYAELLRDVDTLSKEVSGSFYLIFDREVKSATELSEEVFSVGLGADAERTLEATRGEVRRVVGEMGGRQRSVCLVTGDKSLAESVSGPGVHIVQLTDFFQA